MFDSSNPLPIKLEMPECKIAAATRADFVEGCLRGLHMYLPWARREAPLWEEGLMIEPPSVTVLSETRDDVQRMDQEMPTQLQTAVPPPDRDPDTLDLMHEDDGEHECWDMPTPSPVRGQTPERIVRIPRSIVPIPDEQPLQLHQPLLNELNVGVRVR